MSKHGVSFTQLHPKHPSWLTFLDFPTPKALVLTLFYYLQGKKSSQLEQPNYPGCVCHQRLVTTIEPHEGNLHMVRKANFSSSLMASLAPAATKGEGVVITIINFLIGECNAKQATGTSP